MLADQRDDSWTVNMAAGAAIVGTSRPSAKGRTGDASRRVPRKTRILRIQPLWSPSGEQVLHRLRDNVRVEIIAA
jgi:hypothetical protein